MKFLSVLFAFLLCAVVIYGEEQPKPETGLLVRRIREANNIAQDIVRVKRQFGRRGVQSQQSAANAAANSNFFGRGGFGASAANAQAQGFQTQGPLGGFGASAAGTQTQGFTAGRNGIQGSAGASQSQVYHLPNGKTINVAFSNGFSAGPGGISGSRANGVTIN